VNNKLYEKIGGKKSLHVALNRSNHSGFKLECVKRGLSMQEVIEAFSHKITIADTKFINFLDEVALNKTLKISNTNNLGKMDIENIYKIIEDDDQED